MDDTPRPDQAYFGARQGSVRAFGRDFNLPQSRALRVAIGVVLMLLGTLGFLPILGFWMIPLGLLVLSYEFAFVRRLRRRLALWWGRRRTASGS
jgi:hypothetical protein